MKNNLYLILLFVVLSYNPGFALASDREVRTVVQTGHLAPIVDYDISSDGKFLVTCDKKCKIVLWNLATGRQIREMNGSDLYYSPNTQLNVYFNSKSTAVVGVGKQQSLAFDVMTGKQIGYWPNEIRVKKVNNLGTRYVASPNPKNKELAIKRCPMNLCGIVAGNSIRVIDKKSTKTIASIESTIDSIGSISTYLYQQKGVLTSNNEANPDKWWLGAKVPFLIDLRQGRILTRLTHPYWKWGGRWGGKVWRDYHGNIILWDSLDTIYRYSFGSGDFIDKIRLGGYGDIHHLAFLSDNKRIVYDRDNIIWAMNLTTGEKSSIDTIRFVSEYEEWKNYKPYKYKKYNKFSLHDKNGWSRIMGIDALSAPDEYLVLLHGAYVPLKMKIGSKEALSWGNTRDSPMSLYTIAPNLRLVRGESLVSMMVEEKIFTQYLAERNTSIAYFPREVAVGYKSGEMEVFDMRTTRMKKKLQLHSASINDLKAHPYCGLALSASDDGSVAVYNAHESEILAYITSMNQGQDYIIRTPDNYYMSSRYGTDAVSFVIGTDTYSFDQFDLKYNRPDIVLRRIGLATKEQTDMLYHAYQKRLRRMHFTEEMLETDFHVPALTIGNVNELSKATTPQQTLVVTPVDDKYRLQSVNVWINGVPVMETKSPVNGEPLSLPLTLAHGRNLVQVSCLNEKGVESYKQSVEINVEEAQRKPDLWIVCVGASKYKDTRFNLNYAAKDAMDVAEAIKQAGRNSFRQIHTMILADAEVDKEKMPQVHDFFKKAKRDDSVVLFYAGHGVVDENYDYYLGTYDTDFLHPSGDAIAYEDFEKLLDGIEPLKKLLLVDACHSGEIDKDDMVMANATTRQKIDGKIIFREAGAKVPQMATVSAEQINNLITEHFATLQRGTGATVISSASGVEVAMEGSQWKNGLFSYCLLRGLKDKNADSNGDGYLSVFELQNYCQNMVRELSGGKQQPTSRNENRQQYFNIRKF